MMKRSMCVFVLGLWLGISGATAGPWTSWSGDVWNTRFAWQEWKLNRFNVGSLELKWSLELDGITEVNPTVIGNDLYTTDRNGWLYRVDARTGRIIWRRSINSYNGAEDSFSRSSPTVVGTTLYIADSIRGSDPFRRTHVMAIDRISGKLLWITPVNVHRTGSITQSPLVVGNKVYVGISSTESYVEVDQEGYECCSFRGNMVALNRWTGKLIWRTFMIADGFASPDEYSGASVWGRNPAVDFRRGVIYIPTGQNYSVPERMRECERLRRMSPNPELEPSCIEPDINMANSITALDLETGAVVWNQHLEGYDAWNLSCGAFGIQTSPNPGFCPDPIGADYDFAQGPILWSFAPVPWRWWERRQILLAAQKSGVAYGLDPDRGGEVIWATTVGPGGLLGGMEFGSAVDFDRYYVSIGNLEKTPYQLPDGRTVTGGSVAALDPLTGQILWQTPDPASFVPVLGFLGMFTGPLTAIQGVVFAASNDIQGHLYAIDGVTGEILVSFAGGDPSNNGVSIADGRVYWATGSNNFSFAPNSTLYCFGLPN